MHACCWSPHVVAMGRAGAQSTRQGMPPLPALHCNLACTAPTAFPELHVHGMVLKGVNHLTPACRRGDLTGPLRSRVEVGMDAFLQVSRRRLIPCTRAQQRLDLLAGATCCTLQHMHVQWPWYSYPPPPLLLLRRTPRRSTWTGMRGSCWLLIPPHAMHQHAPTMGGRLCALKSSSPTTSVGATNEGRALA